MRTDVHEERRLLDLTITQVVLLWCMEIAILLHRL
jgi:hypothetical protein